MAYTDIDDPSAYFQTKLYTAAGAYTFDGNSDMQPDFVWIKERNGTNEHNLFDSVRGTTKRLESSTNAAEQTSSTTLTAFGSDGFTVGSNPGTGQNGSNYVGWGWKAGTSFTNDASSTGIGGIDSAGSFNNTAGFSIVTYTGNAGNTTVKHGMNVAPSMIIFKRRNANSTNWYTYHASIGQGKRLVLNTTAAEAADTEYMNNTAPTTSVFSLGPSGTVNTTGTHLAYCFAEKKGYSKFGIYTGNNNADGTFIFTGFKPAFVMVKLTDTQTDGWVIQDNKRDISNTGTSTRLRANTGGAEFTSTNEIDFLSNGFKPRGDDGEINGNGSKHIYMAFAENPFVTSTGVPATAR